MKKSSSGLPWPAVIALVALLVAGAVFTARLITSSRPGALARAVETPAAAGQQVKPLGDGMIYYDGTTLHALNGSGQQIWTSAAGSGADFSVASGGVCVWNGTLVTFLESSGGTTLFSGNMSGTVIDARLGTRYAAVQVGTEHDSTVYITETGGRQVDSIDLKDRTILDFGFFNADSLFWVMSLNTEGTVPLCSISTYRPGKMLAGTITDTQQVLYEVVFQSDKIRAIGTTHIKDFDYTGKEIAANRLLVYGWYLMAMTEDTVNPLMAFVPMEQASEASGITDIRLVQGARDERIHLPFGASRVIAMNDTVYAFANQYVAKCTLDSVSAQTFSLPIYVDSVLGVTENGSAIVTSSQKVYMIKLN